MPGRPGLVTGHQPLDKDHAGARNPDMNDLEA